MQFVPTPCEIRPWALLSIAFAALAFHGCASVPTNSDQQLAIDSIEEIEVKTSGVTIETDFMSVTFSGQLIYRSTDGEVKPVSHARVYRQDPRRGAPYAVKLTSDRDGRFSETVSMLVCRSGGEEWPHWPTFTFAAVGCQDKLVELGPDDLRGTIEMTCPGRS